MPRIQDTEEVRILRFFEEGPLEKAELLYNIIAQKMRTRLNGSPAQQPHLELPGNIREALVEDRAVNRGNAERHWKLIKT